MKKRIACFMTIMALLLCAFGLPVEAVGDVIDFTRDSIELYPNQSFQLTMKSSPDINSFYSSDPDIVSVSASGMVTAIAPGSSIITVFDDDNNSASCTVNVHEGVSPTKVIPDIQSLNLSEGGFYTLKAEVEPANVEDGRLYYSSSDEKVVKVDKNGRINALKAGVAVVTIESSSTAVSARCIVKVTSNAGRNFSISLNGTLYSVAGEKKANMVVEIVNNEESFECPTNVDGQFYFDNIVQGLYTLNVFKSSADTQPVSTGQISVGARDMNISCIMNDKDLVVLYQSEKNTSSAEVQDVTLEKSSLTLEKGESFDMSFKVRPANAALPTMKGTSDNAKVAVADVDGRITALSEGNAVITFTTSDNKIKRTCKVTVISPTRNTYSWLIISAEFFIMLLIVLIFFIAYRRFNRRKEEAEGLNKPKKRGRYK